MLEITKTFSAISLKTRQFVTFDTLAFLMQALIEKSDSRIDSVQWRVLLFTLIH